MSHRFEVSGRCNIYDLTKFCAILRGITQKLALNRKHFVISTPNMRYLYLY